MEHKHRQDDGSLTVIADDDRIIIACDKGHAWIIEAKMLSVPQQPAADVSLAMEQPGLMAEDMAVLESLDSYTLRSMGIDDS